MISSDFTYNGITFSRFVRSSGYQADVISGDRITIRSTRDPLPSQDGIQRYKDYYGSRLIEIKGFVKGSSESDLYDNINTLQAAFDKNSLEASTDGTFGFLPLDWTDPGQAEARYYLKPINNTLIVQETRTGLARSFSVLLEAKDPVKYKSVSVTTTISLSDRRGSSVFPFTFPVVFGGSSYVGQATVVNSGSVAVFPVKIVLNGPSAGSWVGPSITNQNTGEAIDFTSSVTLGSGERIEIIPSTGSCLQYYANGTSLDVSPYLTTSSIIWKVGPGSSVISISGDSITDISVVNSMDSGWINWYGNGTVSHDSTTKVGGTASLKIVDSSDTSLCGGEYDLSSSQDWSGSTMSIYVRSDDWSHVTEMKLLLSTDGSFSSFYELDIVAKLSSPNNNQWYEIAFSESDLTVGVGTPSISTVNKLIIRSTATSSYTPTVWADELSIFDNSSNATVDITSSF